MARAAVATHRRSGDDRRDALLRAQWVTIWRRTAPENIAAISRREGKDERHIRLLTLAFVSPRIVAAILDGAPRVGLTATEYKLNHPAD